MNLMQEYKEFCRNENLFNWDMCSEWGDDLQVLQNRVCQARNLNWEPIGPIYYNDHNSRYEQVLKRRRKSS